MGQISGPHQWDDYTRKSVIRESHAKLFEIFRRRMQFPLSLQSIARGLVWGRGPGGRGPGAGGPRAFFLGVKSFTKLPRFKCEKLIDSTPSARPIELLQCPFHELVTRVVRVDLIIAIIKVVVVASEPH